MVNYKNLYLEYKLKYINLSFFLKSLDQKNLGVSPFSKGAKYINAKNKLKVGGTTTKERKINLLNSIIEYLTFMHPPEDLVDLDFDHMLDWEVNRIEPYVDDLRARAEASGFPIES